VGHDPFSLNKRAEALRQAVSDDLIGHEMIESAKLMIQWAKLLIEEATRLSLLNAFVI
jgi:hypothetical protein